MITLVLFCVFFAGCASKNSKTLPPAMRGVEVPDGLNAHIRQLRQEGERNWVLNLNELAVDAMRQGEHELAERALDESILYINAVFGRTPEATKARTLFFSEDVKLFKGDPYERAMTFFYRAILYMQEGDWENARAALRSANFQDTFAEERQHASDWVIFDYLISVCETRLGRSFYAEEAYKRALENYRQTENTYTRVDGISPREEEATFPPPDARDNLLVVIQSGKAPVKHRKGDYGQLLAYRRGSQGDPSPAVAVCGEEELVPRLLDSVFYQAATRGGRPFDVIQGRKVIFKRGSEEVGKLGLFGGLAILSQADSAGSRNAGLLVLGAGLAASLFSHAVQTKADIRAWSTIPDSLGVLTSQHCTGETDLEVRYAGSSIARSTIHLPPRGEGIAVVLSFPPPEPTLLVPPQMGGAANTAGGQP